VNVFPDAVVYKKSDRTTNSSTTYTSPDFRNYPTPANLPSNSSTYPTNSQPQINFPINSSPTTSSVPVPSELNSATWESYRHASHNFADRVAPNPQIHDLLEIKTDWDRLAAAESSISRAAYREALRYLDQIQETRLHTLKIHQLSALIYANLGELKSAYHHCQEVIRIEPNSPKTYYLMAHIADEMGKYDEVKQLLKKAIYLDLYFVAAYLALGDMYGRESDRDRALKMYRSTIDILKALPSDKIVEETDLTPTELIPQVEERMRWSGVGFSL
jgi:chemotaxis protein methyltransferase CheR